MIIYVRIHNLAKKEIIYEGAVIGEVTNSFVPFNIYLSGINDKNENCLIKAQQALSVKFTYNYNSKNLTFFTDGYLVLDDTGFLIYMIHNNICFSDNMENGNFGVETFETLYGIDDFIPIDYSDSDEN